MVKTDKSHYYRKCIKQKEISTTKLAY